MRILCIGNNSVDTDQRVSGLAAKDRSINNGLISNFNNDFNIDEINFLSGYYHTSLVDLSCEQITKISKYFDKIIILDQPIQEWNTPTEFYDTINFAIQIGNKVEWENAQTKENLLYWVDQIKENKSLCVWPFIQMRFDVDGDAFLCCYSRKVLENTSSYNDFNNALYNRVRKSMLQNKSLPDYCSYCYKLEDIGIESPRVQQTIEWATRLDLDSVSQLNNIQTPVSFEICLDNTCNLMCRMCSPKFSSLIEKEYEKLGIIAKDNEYNLHLENLNDLLEIEPIEKLYFAGGEPTANKNFYNFLENCVKKNKTNFVLQINTNAQKISKNFLDIFKHFKKIEFIVSIDGFEKANDYIRWNSDWNSIHKNIKCLIELGATVSFSISLSLYGIFSYYRLCKFLDSTYPGHYVHCQFVYNMYPLIVEYDQDTISEIEQIKELSLYHNIGPLQSFVDGLIIEMKKSKLDRIKLQKFFSDNDILDQSRNSKLSDYIPQLGKYRNLL